MTMFRLVLLLASAMWLAFAGYQCWLTWPLVPLDMSPSDPATAAAHRDALMLHITVWLLYGLMPAIGAWMFLWLGERLKRRA